MTEATEVSMNSSMHSQTQSPFLLLPPELRNIVYKYVVGGHDIQFTQQFHHHSKSSEKDGLCTVICKKPGRSWVRTGDSLAVLMCICHQIRSESKILPFAINEFGGDVPRLLLASTRFFSGRLTFEAISFFHLIVGSWYVIHVNKVVGFRSELKQATAFLGSLPHLKRLTIDWTGDIPHGSWNVLKCSLVEKVQAKLSECSSGEQKIDVQVIQLGDELSWARVAERHGSRPEDQIPYCDDCCNKSKAYWKDKTADEQQNYKLRGSYESLYPRKEVVGPPTARGLRALRRDNLQR
ncbi:hypothetical protein CC86DRAFT_377976 [Ophiobolus disseminans]|uniref:DUF7730 domain-containing protein n=1 Tax=Ophiobolus disseminans TaxID=1469910 RepID=A0A6A7AEH1_9PLEO|nr:hypothetical protein CC86DRAFT_377976 [Ophiobolus disseminans]